MLGLLAADMPLGLNIIEILIHMLNFAILLVAVRFLLYKPIKKFIDKRKQEYIDNEENSKKVATEAQSMHDEYKNLLANAKRKAFEESEEITSGAKIQADEIVNEAKVKAHQMIEKATKDIAIRQNQAKEDLSNSVVDLAVNMASRILEREVNEKDNDIVINGIIEEWKKK